MNEPVQSERESEPPRLSLAILAPLEPGRREWILGLAGIMLLVHSILAFVRGLAGALPGQSGGVLGLIFGLAGLIAMLLLAGAGFNAAVEQLRLAAAGPGARSARRSISGESDWLAARLIILWIIASIALAAGMQAAGYAGLLIAAAILAVVLPAITLILVLTNAFLEALYPPRIMQLIARVGRRDYTLLIMLITLGALAYIVLNTVLNWLGLPAPVRFSLMFGLWLWAVFAWFQLGGEVLWHHRHELNLTAEVEASERPSERFTRDPEALWDEIRQHGGTREMHAELARQLQRSGDTARRLEHGKIHVEALLMAFEDPLAAIDHTDRLLHGDSGFCLAHPRSMLALIQSAAEHGHPHMLAQLCANYLSQFPNSKKCNEVRLTGCEQLADAPNNLNKQAARWFRELMTAELSDEQRTRAQRLLEKRPDLVQP